MLANIAYSNLGAVPIRPFFPRTVLFLKGIYRYPENVFRDAQMSRLLICITTITQLVCIIHRWLASSVFVNFGFVRVVMEIHQAFAGILAKL